MILTSNIAISSYSKLEDIINDYLVKNKFSEFFPFINVLKNTILNVGFGDDVETIININLKEQQLETILRYKNALLVMNTIFVKDEDVLFIHYTDSAYVTDFDGVIKSNILKSIYNI